MKQHTLDYIFISNNLQETFCNVDILNVFSTDHSLVFCSFIKSLKYSKGPGFWKFKNSLISNDDFVEEMKFFIQNTKFLLEQNISFHNQRKSEFLKYEIREKRVAQKF